jgi:hypothetical protein
MGSEWILWRLAGVEWIKLSQDRERRLALVNAVKNFRVPVPPSQLDLDHSLMNYGKVFK